MFDAPRSSPGKMPGGIPPLQVLEPDGMEDATAWLRASITTFGRNVASFLPGEFDAYARVYHPPRSQSGSGTSGPTPNWHERATVLGASLDNPVSLAMLQESAPTSAPVESGSLPPAVLVPLVDCLRGATSTPDRCFFAVWEGWGDTVFPRSRRPSLHLPHRRYHIFTGPLEGALTSLSAISFCHRSANLWWPSDHAWCVATEVDRAWTYVGGARRDIDRLLAESHVETSPTTATALR